MSRIQWDLTGERTYETGVDRGVLYVYDHEGKKYKQGVGWNGLTAINETLRVLSQPLTTRITSSTST